MSYLDELRQLFEQGIDGDGTVLATDVEVLDTDAPADPLGMARAQLSTGRTGYHEGPEGTFRACGSRYGCGYAEAVAVVDPETGEVRVDINSNLRISSQNRPGARKLFKRLNKAFIIPGLTVGDDGCMHFAPEDSCNLRDGDDLAEWLGKGFSTIHANAHLVAELEGGRCAWDVWQASQEHEDPADRLRSLLS